MDPKSEIDVVQKMVKAGGFKVVDVQFEGVVEAMDSRVVAVINKMSETQQAFGVFRVYYEVEGDVRVIEIPVGAVPEETEEGPPRKK
jgi:hypothetical protein